MKYQQKRSYRSQQLCALLVSGALLGACGGGGGGGAKKPPTPPAPTVITYNVTLATDDVLSGSNETGSATATVRHNMTDEQIEVTVTLTGVTASAISVRHGFAGETGSELFALTQSATASEWSLDAQAFSPTNANDLLAGAMHIMVTTAALPNGALRGQALPTGVNVERFGLSAAEVSGASNSNATGKVWLTVNDNQSTLTAHVNTVDLADADAGSIRRALAGNDGPSLAELVQDTVDTNHWFVNGAAATADALSAISNGELYVTLATPSLPGGAVRGQLVPPNLELIVTGLSSDAIVMGGSVPQLSNPAGMLMTTLSATEFTANLNLYSIAAASAVELRQAPAGQNGPVVATFAQDLNNALRWTLSDQSIDNILSAGLNNQTLYVNVVTPSSPGGAARGQILSSASQQPADPSAFAVSSSDPMNAAQLDVLPETIFFTLNREPLPSSVTPQAVIVEMSGSDGSFGDGNEVSITPASVSANGNTIEISLAGVATADDVFRVSLLGGGIDGVVDMSGIPLDGDGNGQPGGTYASAFAVTQPVVVATLSAIQTEIFTPSCASAGCHSGSNPPDDLLLTAGNSYSNIVDVDSVQMSSLKRIKPGDPDNSYLIRKVRGVGIVASRMPLGGSPLSQQQIDLLSQWVQEGANDN